LSISTYAELSTAAANWLTRSDLTSQIPDFITIGEAEIFRKLRIREMETTFSTAISSGVVALPTGYKELKFAYINARPVSKLDRKAASWIYEKYPTRSADNRPKFIAREGSNFIFGPYPDSDYTVTGVYYKNLGPLSSSAHAVFTNNPDLYLYATLVAAEPYIKNDKRLPMWKEEFGRILTSVQMESDKEDESGGGLEMVAS
jgi:hypothetical protein